MLTSVLPQSYTHRPHMLGLSFCYLSLKTFHVFFPFLHKMHTFGTYFVLFVCLLVYFETQSCSIALVGIELIAILLLPQTYKSEPLCLALAVRDFTSQPYGVFSFSFSYIVYHLMDRSHVASVVYHLMNGS